jgi:phytoene synthase
MTPTPSPSAEAITQSSKSNLALAFFSLPKDRKRDITIFYAFCRVVDDIADSSQLPQAQRQAALNTWREALSAPAPGESPLASQVREIIARHQIPLPYFHEIIAGVEMDLVPQRFATFADLRLYCYRVASAVGLVSIEIFGYQNPLCRPYAEALGLALQLTNILRDIAEDYENGKRIYLPLEDLERFGYFEADLAARRYNAQFLALANFQADRAFSFYDEAILPEEDRRSMIAAEIMRGVYSRILWKMKRDGYRVFEKRYRLNGAEKALSIAKTFASNRLGW